MIDIFSNFQIIQSNRRSQHHMTYWYCRLFLKLSHVQIFSHWLKIITHWIGNWINSDKLSLLSLLTVNNIYTQLLWNCGIFSSTFNIAINIDCENIIDIIQPCENRIWSDIFSFYRFIQTVFWIFGIIYQNMLLKMI